MQFGGGNYGNEMPPTCIYKKFFVVMAVPKPLVWIVCRECAMTHRIIRKCVTAHTVFLQRFIVYLQTSLITSEELWFSYGFVRSIHQMNS
jgi:hypothetical protein